MKRQAIWSAIVLSFALSISPAFARKPRPILVQLYGDLLQIDEKYVFTGTAFLILPDGSHAKALCVGVIPSGPDCEIEPFTAEKRVKVPCDLLKGNAKEQVNCYQSESYEADRKGNDITLRTVNGKVTYHIVGPW